MVNEKLRQSDMAHLLAQPEFRRFLFRAAIQQSGILSHTARATEGSDGRDLAFAEGRRSLGFDILVEADAGQPAPMRSPQCLLTLISALTEEVQSQPEEKVKRDRYDRDSDDGNDSDG